MLMFYHLVEKFNLVHLLPISMPDKLVAVAKTSTRGSSLRITLPKEIAEKLNVSESEHIGFYEVEGEILIRKIS